jgi:signal transduction histidine kinase
LLELSRIESGQTTLRPEAVSPASLAEDAVRRLRAQAERSGIAISADVQGNLPLLWVDPMRVTQVLIT